MSDLWLQDHLQQNFIHIKPNEIPVYLKNYNPNKNDRNTIQIYKKTMIYKNMMELTSVRNTTRESNKQNTK